MCKHDWFVLDIVPDSENTYDTYLVICTSCKISFEYRISSYWKKLAENVKSD
jgi:transcription elongation factor Elf1